MQYTVVCSTMQCNTIHYSALLIDIIRQIDTCNVANVVACFGAGACRGFSLSDMYHRVDSLLFAYMFFCFFLIFLFDLFVLC